MSSHASFQEESSLTSSEAWNGQAAFLPKGAKFVWSEPSGSGRNVFVIFRRRFQVEERPDSCRIHLFAATRYRLRVNGHFIGHGPARNIPERPEFDSYDISQWLTPGANVVTVEVNAFGEGSFQATQAPGTFIAWGGEEAGLNFATPGTWRCQRSDAWDDGVPSWSFAQSAIELLDHRLLPTGVFSPDFDDTAWACPVLHAAAHHWGPLIPRSIAHPSGNLFRPAKITFLAALSPQPRVGFRIPDDIPQKSTMRYALASWIHSPVPQKVELQLFWGPFFLNGHPLQPVSNEFVGNCQRYLADLNQGWNLLFGTPAALLTGWSQMIAWPAPSGISLHAEPDLDCPDAVCHTGALPEHTFEGIIANPPVSQGDLAELPLAWTRVPMGSLPGSPCVVMAWDRYAPNTPPESCKLPLVFPSGEASVVFDFGGEFLGHLMLDITGHPGAVVDVAYGELLRADGSLLLLDRHNVLPADRYILSERRQQILSFHPRGGRYTQITIRAQTPPVLHAASIKSSLQPEPPEGPFFACSDDVLTKAWDMGRKTLLAAREDAWLDCPLRERGAYIGDGLVQSRAYAPIDAHDKLTSRCLRLWAGSQMPDGQLIDNFPSSHASGLADYTLLFVHLVHEHYARTGDLHIVHEFFPVICRIFSGSYWKSAPSGLWKIEKERLFIDWAVKHEGKRGESGVLNAFRHKALLLAADLADLIGEKHGDSWRTEAARVANSFQSLWDETLGCYAGTRIDGKLSEHGRLHTNLLGILYDLVPPQRRESVIRRIRECLRNNNRFEGEFIELYFHHFAAEALYHIGLAGDIEDLFRQSHSLMQERGAWTLWESLHRGVNNYGSLCHAWSASFNWVAAERILGVRIETPGHPDHLLIAPESDTLSWARGAVSHPRGLVQVSWAIREECLHLSVETPPGVTYQIAPKGRLATLSLVQTSQFVAPLA